MNRAELEGLDRESLVARAEAAGVARARTLTRPELVDELLMRAHGASTPAARRARGFFGLARDLLANVVERGLHLPDAADRIRGIGAADPPRDTRAASALPTMTLAEIYASQGHRERAIETLEQVLEREPEHAAARALHADLTRADYVAPAPPLPPEGDEPDPSPASEEEEDAALPGAAASADEEVAAEEEAPVVAATPPPSAGVRVAREPVAPAAPAPRDRCEALPIEPGAWHVRFSVSPETLIHLAERHEVSALILRAVQVFARWEGPASETRDFELDAPEGEVRVEAGGADVVRIAIGARVDGAFVPLAHAPWVELGARGGPERVRWTPRGLVRESAQAL